ncbi:1-propanol dehydrogenase PduQ [Enterococcus olivae]
MNEFSIPSNVVFDTSIESYFNNCQMNKIFIVSDPMMIQLGFIKTITEILKKNKLEFFIFSDITPDPTIETIAKGLLAMNDFAPKCLVAIGGGSAIDTAKGMVLSNFQIDQNYKKPEFIAIPSTSGTGSEVTSFTVITNGKDKKPFVDKRLIPDVALLDVNLVKSVPAKITADTGMDVLTHAIEAYVSTNSNSFTDALSEKAVSLVFENLITAFNEPENLYARKKMHEASAIAGMAFTNSSLGINHSLAHAIGGLHHLPHGRINAILLPAVISFNSKSEKVGKYQNLAKLLGLPSNTLEEGVNNLKLAISYLNEALGIEKKFSSFSISKENYENVANEIAELALKDDCTKTNPKNPSIEEFKQIYLSLY